MDIYVQSLLNSGTKLLVTVTNSTTIAQLKSIVSNLEGVTSTIMSFHFDGIELLNTSTLSSNSISSGTFIRSANSISQLPLKSSRQLEKLNLAQQRRKSNGNTSTSYYRIYNTADVDLLADKYVSNTSTVGTTSTLTVHRPWI